MKTVIISPIEKPISYRLHEGFLRKLPNSEVIEGFSKKNGITIPIEAIKEKNPDVVIIHTHNDYLKGYLKSLNCLKVMVAVDYHKKDRLSFYKSNNIDLIVFRGNFNTKEIDNFWLPFSADEKIFKPLEWDKRFKKVCFIGSVGKIYKERNEVLRNSNYIINLGRIVNGYPETIRNFSGIFVSSELNSPYGKLFEAAGCGTIPVLRKFKALESLFPSKGYQIYENIDFAIQKVINNKRKSGLIYDDFMKYHTDEKRISELYNNLQNLLEGKNIIDKWR